MSDTPQNHAQEAALIPTPSSSSQKGVTIFDEPERIEVSTPDHDETRSPTLVGHSPKTHRASTLGKKMTGRPPMTQTLSSSSLMHSLSDLKLDSPEKLESPAQENADPRALLTQVMDWLNDERNKRSRQHDQTGLDGSEHKAGDVTPKSHRRESELALDKLESILAGFSTASAAAVSRLPRKPSILNLRRGSLAKKLMKTGTYTSDTDAIDTVAEVPHVEASLDNSKTMAYSGGEAGADVCEATRQRNQKCWDTFKSDIIRLTHTLGLRGWRRIPIENGSSISVERLSGALTNAVYVVKPPKEMPEVADSSGSIIPARKPNELLLRIYGPQVEHLIDRDRELSILRRLVAKNIGPKLLGYFTNGRFEEFLHATTLKPEDLRDPATSKQIAKRMKELHEGIDLLESERAEGPFVFCNWDKWVDRCEKVITWLDQQVHDDEKGQLSSCKKYTQYGLICGVEWKTFRSAYDRYRKKLIEESGGNKALRKHLVFAHNDTQYGNLMRLSPPSESPLMQPTNQHKQLVVIDFEYSSANVPGLEFANHFTEWCYNYHHPELSWSCNTSMYPTEEEQHRFIRAYVMHRPQFASSASSASSTPQFLGKEKTNIPDFMLDARAPGGGYGIDYDVEERAREEAQERDIQKLLHQTRLWRIANSAMWVAWGIVQAKIPELDEPKKKSIAGAMVDKVKQLVQPRSDPLDPEVKELQKESKEDRPEGRLQEEAREEGDDAQEEEEDEEEEFDYLAYARDRAMFFWGDCILMGIIAEEDLPAATRKEVKYVKY